MEKQILQNTESLLRGHIITAVLYFALIIAVAFITTGVIRLKLINAKWKNILFVCFVVLASVALLAIQCVKIAPIYRDCKEQAYTVIDDARVTIIDGTSGGLDRMNRVVVYDGEKKIELKIQSDYRLDTEVEYVGKIAYLENSNYLIWYEFK